MNCSRILRSVCFLILALQPLFAQDGDHGSRPPQNSDTANEAKKVFKQVSLANDLDVVEV